MKKRTKVTAWILGIVILLLIGTWFFMDYGARHSSFCDNCHYMEPYVAQWQESTHSGIECIECHPTQRKDMIVQFVKYATGTYNPRPRAYVPDEACAVEECHVEMRESPDVPFMSMHFPHKPHLDTDRRGIKLHCASCHGASREAGHVSVDVQVCFLCHFKGQAAASTYGDCRSCHAPPEDGIQSGCFVHEMQEYVSSGVPCDRCHQTVHEGGGLVPRERCYECHMTRDAETLDRKVIHEQHVGKKEIRCLDCHDPIRHGNIKLISVLDISCESCHTSAHAGPREMYLGIGAQGAPPTPSRMFAAQINCSGCHTQVITEGDVALLGKAGKAADPRACAACHDSRYIPMVETWKSQGRQLAAEARRMANEGRRIAGSTVEGSDVMRLTEDLEFNARFLEEGHPVHNIEYAVKVVQASSGLLDELGKAARQPADSDPRVSYAKDAFSYCIDSCHTFIEQEEPYQFHGVDVPHRYHIEEVGLSCDMCHEEGRHKNLNFESPRECASCHHDDTDADCARCHRRQSAMHLGEIPVRLGITAEPDTMSEMVGCDDCHDPTVDEPLAAVAEACNMCHEEQGAEFLESWKTDLGDGFTETLHLEEELNMILEGQERRREDTTLFRKRLQVVHDRLDYLERARGVHNMAAAEAIFGQSKKDLQALIQEAQGK